MYFAQLNVLFLASFLLSAAVQYNDPDPIAWVAIYLAGALMCIAQMRSRQPRWLPPSLLLISLAWIGTLLPNVVGRVSVAEVVESITMQTTAVEEAREIGGLVIIGLWAACIMAKQHRGLHST